MPSRDYKIRLGEERRAKWDAAAAAVRRSLADWIKVTCDKEAESGVQPSGRPQKPRKVKED